MSQAPVWRIEAWNLQLLDTQATHIRHLAQEFLQSRQNQPTLKAWLVLDAWADNWAAAWLESAYPEWAKDRQTVPDPRFLGMEDHAPCVLSLDDWPRFETDASRRLDGLHDLLGLMWCSAQRRLGRTHACGFLLTAGSLEDVFDHWLMLGSQVAPDGQRKTVQHWDPRVLQRVWPALGPAQRRVWLGPVHSVWQVTQPWGPWAPDHLSREQHMLLGKGSAWHVASLPQSGTPLPDEPAVPVHRLLSQSQHDALSDSLPARMAWQTMARAGMPIEAQPNDSAMQRMCLQMRSWCALHQPPWSVEAARQWLWCTWLGVHSAQPLQATNLTPIDWQQSPWRERSVELVRLLREEPDADLRTHFEELLVQPLPHVAP